MMTMTISCYFWWIPFVCFLLSEKNVDRYFLFVKKWSSHIQNDYSFQRIQTTNTVMEFHYKKNENPDITIIMMMIIFLMIMGKKRRKENFTFGSLFIFIHSLFFVGSGYWMFHWFFLKEKRREFFLLFNYLYY